MKYIISLLVLTFSITANSAVRWNQTLRIWEGNICMNNLGWQVVNWQPLGSLCWMQLPGRPPMQGIIINA
jgi:hypothetical protein